MNLRAAFAWLLVAVATGAAQTPSVAAGGVLNTASFDRNLPVTAGSLVAIFGSELAAGLAQASTVPLSNTLDNVSVTFNNVAAPLLFVSMGQVNAQIPWNVLPEGTLSGNAPVIVRRGAASSQPVEVRIAEFSPGIFTLQSGIGQAIAINPDGSLAAPAGSIQGFATQPTSATQVVIILGTGLGAVDPPIGSGEAGGAVLRNTRTPARVLIGGREAQLLFSGLSPQFPGVNQINVIVPSGVTAGDRVPLQVEIGGIRTSDQVTIAVR